MKILAAIVTHNRRQLLERCIGHVRGQSRPPDRLIVINNASTDGTLEMLEQNGVEVVTQPNLGSAGGWKRAMEEAIAGDCDAVWLMDDDGYPAHEALEVLDRRLVPDVACVSSVVLCEQDPRQFVFPFPVLNRRGLPVLLGRRRKLNTLAELKAVARGDTYPFAHLFNGALIRTDVIRRIGTVDSNFFLMGDEVDYFMRMRAIAPVISDLRAHQLHPDVSRRKLDPVKVYYYVKNTIILNGRYFDHVFFRNSITIIAAFLRTARRNSVGDALSYLAGRRAPILWRAIARGLRGQIGSDFVG